MHDKSHLEKILEPEISYEVWSMPKKKQHPILTKLLETSSLNSANYFVDLLRKNDIEKDADPLIIKIEKTKTILNNNTTTL